MNKVFLGGTCNDTTWRDELIAVIQVDYFNPVVDDWTEDCQLAEELEKSDGCNIHLYVITSEMMGVFSIAEAVQSSNEKGKVTIFHVIPDGFSVGQHKSLKATCDLISRNGGISYIDQDLHRTSRVINYCFK